MSEKALQESTQQFLQMLFQNQQFQERLSAIDDRETFLRSCVNIGKEKGYDFNIQEVEEFMKLMATQQQGELSEEELEAVAGGGFFSKAKEKVITWGLELLGKPVAKPHKGPRWPIE
jgi:predicted ribosomally synthesized peptide with nif11-like leader